MDFVTDQLADGRYFRVVTVVDQFSRECVALHAAVSIRSKDVGEVLDAAIQRRSAPVAITCDNGTEFTSRHFDAWAYFRKIDLDFIRPGKPVENAFIESGEVVVMAGGSSVDQLRVGLTLRVAD
jgi:putative transposase